MSGAKSSIPVEEEDVVKSINELIDHHDQGENVLTRLSTLSKTLSQYNAEDLANLQIDKSDFELKEVLSYIQNKNNKIGVCEKQTGVELRNVNVLGVNDFTSYVKTVGDFFGAPILTPWRRCFSKKSTKPQGDNKYRKILRNVNINVEPGEVCLILGRPGAGCSSLLKTIAGETDQFIRVDGDISYNNISQDEMMKLYKRDIIYNPELDVHFPHLTVDQTLKFAIGCKTPQLRFDNLSRAEYINTIRDLWVTVFGLSHTLNTKVGNDFVRGISGGERKRTSLAEAMAARGTVYCWDNATRGLDASTALEFAEAIRTSTNLTKTTSFIAIYQAGEGIYSLFDKVSVLYHGYQIYFGSTKSAKQYFIDMGFECPPRQATAEFLTAITDPLGRFPRKGYENKVPKNAKEFEEYWLQSLEYANLQHQLSMKRQSVSAEETAQLFHDNLVQEKMKGQRIRSKFTINFREQLKICTIRSAQNIIGNKAYTIVTLVTSIVQSLLIGSLFYNLPNSTQGAFSRGGAIYFPVLYFSMSSLAGVSAAFDERPILMKQKGYSFYHPSANVVSSTLTQLPLKTIATLLYAIVLYFLVGLKMEAGAFFTFVLFMNLTAQTMNAMFLFFAQLVSTLTAAMTICGVFILASVLYSSYMIQRPSMHPWFKWYSYMNPILYGFELMLTTEFHGRKMKCNNLVPNGTGYEHVLSSNQVCGFLASDGKNYVDGDNYMKVNYEYYFDHVWRNFGILILFWFGYLTLTCIASEFIRPVEEGQEHLSFIRGAKIPDYLIGPEEESNNDLEKVSDSINIQCDIDDEKANREMRHTNTTLGTDEVFMWQHVNYSIPFKGEQRQLLNDVQGYVKPGTLTALMGESGAGKTTLLNVLSQRVDVGVITGDMLVNGRPPTRSFMRRTGYVQQQDVHILQLTVRESLRFAARLRRPQSVSDEEKLNYVEKVIQVLQMEDYADAIAGKGGVGLNVEQRKKLSIATEMVAKPDLLLFLDEPTSGLDSQSSWSIVKILRDLARAGQSILCTIHQPSATLFNQFDRVLLLQKGGQTVYFGDIGENSKTILDYFADNGASRCSDDENPAEYILEVIGAGATADVNEDWFKKWTSSVEYRNTVIEIETLIQQTSMQPVTMTSEENDDTYAMPYWFQFQQVLQRASLEFNRDVAYIRSKILLLVNAGLFVGFSFWNVKHTEVGMQNALFAVFMTMIVSAPVSNQIQSKAIQARELYEVRESKSNTFHWSTLLMSQWLMEIPYSIVFSTVYFIEWYFLIQLDNAANRMGVFWLIYCIFFQLFYTSFALAIVYLAPDLPTANIILAFLFNFIFAFCGVAQPVNFMPGFWTFMYKVSPYTYFVQSLLSTVLHGRQVHCADRELSNLNPPLGKTCGEYLDLFLLNNPGYISNPNATSQCAYCPYSVADDYLDHIGVKYSDRWRNVGFFCVYICFNVFSMFAGYYYFRVSTFSLVGVLKKRFSKRT